MVAKVEVVVMEEVVVVEVVVSATSNLDHVVCL
jgi:hypothetical protein